ncbi:hypothetical protein BCV69DRAFT_280109 [Microstroma glucosiphilum]|uniref:FAS1 domain-containing protein n=1 Tax=Pseudomicrostroma glucosiphilum TaxID=1684307 RepID=A0A316ULY8_9BASI|nr:hypothetical protein BCV69DRAFT_280109 [Pseudomicrostroma glucosiphilum]PWN24215.1 hypothetical protein BCV69DRAFT_280109 [Pseudomicrostroma glucosiphilum]
MKAFTYAAIAVAGASSVAAFALEPVATAAPMEKRQNDSPLEAITGLLNPLTSYLTNPGIASVVQSVAANTAFAGAASAAAMSDYAPIESLVSSLQGDAGVSSAIYSALGTSSASAFYASASSAVAELAAASGSVTTTSTGSSVSSMASSAASSVSSELSSLSASASMATSSAGTAASTSAAASGAFAAVKAGNVLPAVLVVVGVAAGAFML